MINKMKLANEIGGENRIDEIAVRFSVQPN
jgi:hypothetical protein